MADAGDARLVEALRRALDFANLDDEQLSRLVTASSLERFAAGDALFDKGSAADGLYVVVEGSIRILDVFHGNERDLALIGPGDFTGEVSMALHTTRTRSAQAKEDSEVLVIPTGAFDELAAEHPTLGSQLIEAFEDRMARREDAAAEE
ncbi:MAG TPA: cyclic nucleotide-binding domain-containing protein [Actinomycetota bacterium]|nr:cyclic nucleotide-binding domain-containing protein [Actinomycetota bacterium]